MAFFERLFSKNKGRNEKPDPPRKDTSLQSGGFVPSVASGPLLGMSVAMVNTAEGLPTLFIGIVDETYTESMWNDCVTRLKSAFNIKPGSFHEIKISSQKDDPSRVDGDALNEKVSQALKTLNESKVKFVRIARLGVGSSLAIFEALEGLLKGWQQDIENKNVQFITVGESNDKDNFDFCKWLCLKRLCSRLEFCSTMDYTMMGIVDYAQTH